jgi:hypothetical protein
MRKFLLTLAAIPAATMAVEASAQTNMNAGGAVGIQNRIANLEARLNAGAQARVFTNSEYSNLTNQLSQLRGLERQYSANGLTASERRQLQNRIRVIRDDLRTAGGNSWANRYGWTDRDLETYSNYSNANAGVRYDQYGRPIATGNVTYDQYGRPMANSSVSYDQYGRPINNGGVVYDQNGRVIQGVAYDQNGRPVMTNGGYYGQGGPYQPVPQQQGSGLGGVLGSVLGGAMGGNGGAGGVLGSILGGGGLGVGDVITSTIGSVLRGGNTYGTQYRDNNSTYFRSDGQRVYEIDARTNTVVRIHPLR